MPSQDLNTAAIIKPFTADAAITQYAAVVLVIATEDHTNLPAGANSALFLGFATDAILSGAVGPVQMTGIARAKLGATTALGDFLMINGALGDLKPLVLGASNQYVVAKALRGGLSGDVIPVQIMQFVAQGA